MPSSVLTRIVSYVAILFCPAVNLNIRLRLFGADQNEGDAAWLVAPIRPAMQRSPLNHQVACPQVHFGAIVEQHVDFSLDDDHVVESLGLMHKWLRSRGKLKNLEHRSCRRRRRRERL